MLQALAGTKQSFKGKHKRSLWRQARVEKNSQFRGQPLASLVQTSNTFTLRLWDTGASKRPPDHMREMRSLLSQAVP